MMIAKLERTQIMHTKTKTNTEPNKQLEVHKTMYKQQQKHCLKTDSSLSYLEGLNAFYRHTIYPAKMFKRQQLLSFYHLINRNNTESESFKARKIHNCSSPLFLGAVETEKKLGATLHLYKLCHNFLSYGIYGRLLWSFCLSF